MCLWEPRWVVPSAAWLCCGNELSLDTSLKVVPQWKFSVPVCLLLLPTTGLWSQLDTGVLRVVAVDERGGAVSGATISVHGTPAAYVVQARSGDRGLAVFVLPYGEYHLGSGHSGIYLPPLRIICVRAVIDRSDRVSSVRETP